MQFDKDKSVFILEPGEADLLAIEPDHTVWPVGEADHLVDLIEVSKNMTDAIHPEEHAEVARRSHLSALKTVRFDRLRGMGRCVASHAMLSDADIQRLLDK